MIAILEYYDTTKVINPIKRELALRDKELAEANRRVHEMLSQLEVEEAKVKKLFDQHQAVKNEKDKLHSQIIKISAKLTVAESLMKNLPQEKERWKYSGQEMLENAPNVVGDSLLCSAAISYFGAFTGPFRF